MTQSQAPPRHRWWLLAPLFMLVGWLNECVVFTAFEGRTLSVKEITMLVTFLTWQKVVTAGVSGFFLVTIAARDENSGGYWQLLGIIMVSLALCHLILKLPWFDGSLGRQLYRGNSSVFTQIMWVFGEFFGVLSSMKLAKWRLVHSKWTMRLNQRLEDED